MMSDLNMPHGKMSDFGFALVIKLRNVDFERHWNTLIYFFLNKSDVNLNVSCQTMSDLV